MRQLCTLDLIQDFAAIACMHDVQINIRWPNGKERNSRYQLPEKWSEIPKTAWPAICMYLLAGNSESARLHLTYLLLRKARSRKRVNKDIFYLLSPAQLEMISGLVSWLFSEKITAPPLQYFRIRRKKYYLPQAELKYISVAEYAFADFYFEMYKEAAESGAPLDAEDYLNSLISTLCRPLDKRIDPKDPDTFKGDLRQKYNGVLAERNKPLIAQLPVATKLAVLMFFSGCKSHLHEQYKGLVWMDMHDKEGKPVINAKPGQPQEWIDLTFTLSGGKFGSLNETMETPLDTVLHELVLQNQKA